MTLDKLPAEAESLSMSGAGSATGCLTWGSYRNKGNRKKGAAGRPC